MKELFVFIASSIDEFKEERRQLRELIEEARRIFKQRGLYLDSNVCENKSNRIETGRKQDSINEDVKNSAFFVMLVGNRIGDYTREEFDVALETFAKNGKWPSILVYFDKDAIPDEGVKEFRRYLEEELSHYTTDFGTVDELRLLVMMELTEGLVGLSLDSKDGEAVLDGQSMFSLKEIPSYAKNENVIRLNKELELAAKELELARKRFEQTGAEDEIVAMKDALDKKRKIEEDLRVITNEIIKTLSAERDVRGDERLKNSFMAFKKGKYKTAIEILSDSKWTEKVKSIKRDREDGEKDVRNYIRGQKLLVSTLLSSEVIGMVASQVKSAYENALSLAIKWQIEVSVIYDYGEFLLKQKRYENAEEVAAKLLAVYELSDDADSLELVLAHRLFGKILTERKETIRAEISYKKALEILEKIGEKTPVIQKMKARLLADIAYQKWRDNAVDESLDYSAKTLKILESLDEEDFLEDDMQVILGECHNTIGLALVRKQEHEAARDQYIKAYNVRKALYEKNNTEHCNFFASTCNNLGFLYRRLGQFEESGKYFEDAYLVRKSVVNSDPMAYLPSLGLSATNLGTHYRIVKEYEKSYEVLNEALNIRTQLYKMDSKTYEMAIAYTNAALGNLCLETKDLAKAEEYFGKSLEIRRKGAKSNPNFYKKILWNGRVDMSACYCHRGRYSQALELLSEAFSDREKVEDIMERKDGIYLYAKCLETVALFGLSQYDKALSLISEELNFYKKLSLENPYLALTFKYLISTGEEMCKSISEAKSGGTNVYITIPRRLVD